MRVLVDTSVWSLALRRQAGDLSPEQARLRRELADLISDDRVLLIGAIRQELLSGVRDLATYEKLRARLRDFADEPLVADDYEAAARAQFSCREAGIAGSAIDLLICAVALRRGIPVFTTDRDFERYAEVVPIRLFRTGAA